MCVKLCGNLKLNKAKKMMATLICKNKILKCSVMQYLVIKKVIAKCKLLD